MCINAEKGSQNEQSFEDQHLGFYYLGWGKNTDTVKQFDQLS